MIGPGTRMGSGRGKSDICVCFGFARGWQRTSTSRISLLADCGVNLGSRNVGVREDGLNGSEVRPMIEHVRGRRMPEHVRADVRDLDSLGQRVEDLPETHSR